MAEKNENNKDSQKGQVTPKIKLKKTKTKVVIGYITCELYITSFVKNNKFSAIIKSFFDENSDFFKQK
jgi:hypothetical protein